MMTDYNNRNDSLSLIDDERIRSRSTALRAFGLFKMGVQDEEIKNPLADSSLLPEVVEPLERSELPWLIDPAAAKAKVSIWQVIHDNVGKEFAQIGVPVYFNDPLNLMQKNAQFAEYYEVMLQKANNESDPLKRMAYVMVCCITFATHLEKQTTKPFNPLVGETFEYENDDLVFLAEQVMAQPPVIASYCRSKRNTFTVWANSTIKSKFNGKNLVLHETGKTFIELPKWGE